MTGDEGLAVGLGHHQGVLAHHRRLASERAIDLELHAAEFDHPRRGKESPRHREGGGHFQRSPETHLVGIVGVANPRDAALLHHFEPV